ncbi:MAG TPA: TIGR02281 family clan AA aspartic protease [Burkholderiales bacterium]|nr:TIGR02281 family clan AA aspartic protease [Burkholderiales bacterium]HXJ09192.1 TIGR02281 family clan AA aspartic protease [Burkholderiales bacterium]
MATGFMPNIIAFLLLFAWLPAALAAEVALIGVIGDKGAVLSLDGGDPKAVKVGQKWNGITVLEVRKDQATIEQDGKKRVLHLGQHYRGTPGSTAAVDPASGAGEQSVVLTADGAGHFFTMAQVNGVATRFLVDTGATMIALPGGEAQRMGIDYRKGTRRMTNTANGTVAVYQVRLDTIRLGDIEITNLDAVVIEEGLNIGLLGMSFLNRVNMTRQGDSMTLTKRF